MSFLKDVFVEGKKLDERENLEANSIYSNSLGFILIINIMLIMVYDTLAINTNFFNYLSPRYFIIYPSLVISLITTLRLAKRGIVDKVCATFSILLFPMFTIFGLTDVLEVFYEKNFVIMWGKYPLLIACISLVYLWVSNIYHKGLEKSDVVG